MKVVTPSPELMKGLKKVGDEMLADWKDAAGKEGEELLKKYISEQSPGAVGNDGAAPPRFYPADPSTPMRKVLDRLYLGERLARGRLHRRHRPPWSSRRWVST